MKARISVERVHAAAVASLPYWQEKLEEAKAKAKGKTEYRLQELLAKRNWCGGFKYNEAKAWEVLRRPQGLLWSIYEADQMDCGVGTYTNVLNEIVELMDKTEGKSGFNVQLSEKEYNRLHIWL